MKLISVFFREYCYFILFLGLLAQSTLWLSLDSSDPFILKRISEILIILLFSVIFISDSKFSIPSVLVIGLLIRMNYHSYTSFSGLYGGDAALDLLLANTLVETSELSIINHNLYNNRLAFYSAWPMSQLSVACLSMVGGISTLTSSHAIRIIFFVTTLFCHYCIIRWFCERGLGSTELIKWGLLVPVFMPDMVYWQMEVVRQNFGILSHSFFLFTVLKLSERRNKLFYSVLIILSCLCLSFSHTLTSAISVMILISFTIFLELSSRKMEIEISHFRSTLMNVTSMIAITTMLWWVLVGEVLFPKIRGVLRHFYEILTGTKEYFLDPTSVIPPELSPGWIFPILIPRDVIIMGLTAIGFIRLSINQFSEKPSKTYLIFGSLVLSYVCIFTAFFFWTEPFRVLTMVTPLMAVSFMYSIEWIGSKLSDSNVRDVLLVHLSIFLLLFPAAFLAPFSHAYSPLYVFDDEMQSTKFGEASPNSEAATHFVLGHSSEINVTVDFPDNAFQFIDLENLSRFSSLDIEVVYGSGENEGEVFFANRNDISLFVRDGSIYNPSRKVAHETGGDFFTFATEFREETLQTLEMTSNKIYEAEGASIWYKVNV